MKKKEREKLANPTLAAINATRPRTSMGRPSVFRSKREYSRAREKESVRRAWNDG